MTLLRAGLILVFCLGGGFACTPAGPERASDIQNLNGIGDDISAVDMTDSSARQVHDPNATTTLPNTYQTIDNN